MNEEDDIERFRENRDCYEREGLVIYCGMDYSPYCLGNDSFFSKGCHVLEQEKELGKSRGKY